MAFNFGKSGGYDPGVQDVSGQILGQAIGGIGQDIGQMLQQRKQEEKQNNLNAKTFDSLYKYAQQSGNKELLSMLDPDGVGTQGMSTKQKSMGLMSGLETLKVGSQLQQLESERMRQESYRGQVDAQKMGLALRMIQEQGFTPEQAAQATGVPIDSLRPQQAATPAPATPQQAQEQALVNYLKQTQATPAAAEAARGQALASNMQAQGSGAVQNFLPTLLATGASAMAQGPNMVRNISNTLFGGPLGESNMSGFQNRGENIAIGQRQLNQMTPEQIGLYNFLMQQGQPVAPIQPTKAKSEQKPKQQAKQKASASNVDETLISGLRNLKVTPIQQ